MPAYVTSDRCQCLAVLISVNQVSAMPGADVCCRCLLACKEKDTDWTARKPGSGKLKSASTLGNKAAVEDMILSQEDQRGTRLSQREIADESVPQITKALGRKSYKRIHLSRRDQNVNQKGGPAVEIL